METKALTYDLTGKTYGALTVIGRAKMRKGNGTMWACQCECGELLSARLDALKDGSKVACDECTPEVRKMMDDTASKMKARGWVRASDGTDKWVHDTSQDKINAAEIETRDVWNEGYQAGRAHEKELKWKAIQDIFGEA